MLVLLYRMIYNFFFISAFLDKNKILLTIKMNEQEVKNKNYYEIKAEDCPSDSLDGCCMFK